MAGKKEEAMLSHAEFVRFRLLYEMDPELADAALRKVAEWRSSPAPKGPIPSPEEAFAALISPEASEEFAQILRADRAKPEAAFIVGKRIIRLPDGRKVRPTANGYIVLPEEQG
jgi:hypothetical protein